MTTIIIVCRPAILAATASLIFIAAAEELGIRAIDLH